MEQLMVTPIRALEFVLGKSLPFAIICFVAVIVITLVGILWFGIQIKGIFLLLLLGSVLFLMSTT
ncbi:MAG: hypothetical protein Q7I97_08350 [Thermovirgaceae bacterium]|nr:hypothetical protein [Thermovirgaceae bacterium]